jgi:hypothetical protein
MTAWAGAPGIKNGHPGFYGLAAGAIAHKDALGRIFGPQTLLGHNRQAWMLPLAQ